MSVGDVGEDLEAQAFASCRTIRTNTALILENDSCSSSVADKFDVESLDDGFWLPPPQVGLGEDAKVAPSYSDLDDDVTVSVHPMRNRYAFEVSRSVSSMAVNDSRCAEVTVRISSHTPGMIVVLGDEMFATKVLPCLTLVDAGVVLCCGRCISRRALELFWRQFLRDHFHADSALVQVALHLLTASRAHAASIRSLARVVTEGLRAQSGPAAKVVPGSAAGGAEACGGSLQQPRGPPAVRVRAPEARTGARLPQPAAWAAGRRRSARAARRPAPRAAARPLPALEAFAAPSGPRAGGRKPRASRASRASQRAGGKWWRAAAAATRGPPSFCRRP